MKNYSSLLIGGKQFSSRLMVGTGKYKSTQDMVESLSNSGTEIIYQVFKLLHLKQWVLKIEQGITKARVL